ncbi:hypothetical protein TNCV_1284931 [Trichonephila clavipes]|uniref:Uncharacterized protein n=1 Tax=Trichonephila clavipes TaxID=2585209 RepID=A0A8X6VP66_TRICX|nr:hypothetical protein TNCV_1284931 [Trichonephila clavipes]
MVRFTQKFLIEGFFKTFLVASYCAYQSNTIKPKIEIKMAPHRPRKSGPTEYTTNEEDMIIFDVEEEPELNPKYVLNMDGFTYKGEL